jgi:hypothetical protein
VTLFVASSDLGRTNTNADPFFLAQGVGGVWFDILSADFSAVLQSILDTVITSWRFTYITTNPECDGTQRITEIIITDPDVGVAGDFSTYVAPDDCDDPDPDPDPDYGPASSAIICSFRTAGFIPAMPRRRTTSGLASSM